MSLGMKIHSCMQGIKHRFSFAKMPHLTKDQRVWVCIENTKTNNVREVNVKGDGRDDGIVFLSPLGI